MDEELEKTRLDETRKSIRARVTRQSLAQTGLPLDLTPVFEHGQKRFGKIGLGLATFLGLGGFLWFVFRPMTPPPATYGDPVASLVFSRGSAKMFASRAEQDQNRLLPLDLGTSIHAGVVLETGDSPERVALRMADGKSLRLDSNTRVEVASRSAVVLDRGAVYIDSADVLAGMEVRTTLGVVRDIGTQFEVRILGDEERQSLRVRVREGKILLRHRQENHGAEAGEEIEMHGDGSLTRGTVSVYGPEWDWVLEAAPTPDLRSIAVQSLIDWLARETGKTFRFADEEYSRLAPTLIVNGYVGDDQTAMEAVEGLLESEGLEMQEEGEGVVVLVKAREP